MEDPLIRLLKNRYFIVYIGLYILSLILLDTAEGFSLAEPVFIFLIIGIGFSGVAWLVTKGVAPLPFSIKEPVSESILLAIYLLVIVGFLTWGINLIEGTFQTEPLKSVVMLTAKLTVFVIAPLFLFRWLWKYHFQDFINLSMGWKKHLRVALWVSLMLILFQLVFGRGLSEIRHSGFGTMTLMLGVPFAYLWLIVEAGLVEEFFFRTLLQSRLALLFRSEVAGVFLMSLLFGLAHAPGMYFRTAKTFEPLGPSPSLLMAIGYSIAVTSVTGFFLGILWVRTKNLPVLIFIHATGDLVPNIVKILKAWHL